MTARHIEQMMTVRHMEQMMSAPWREMVSAVQRQIEGV